MFEGFKRYLDSLEFDFVRWRYIAGAVSGLLMVASWVVFVAIGPNWGIDFTGGTEIHLQFAEATPIADVRTALRALDLSDDAVQAVNGEESGEFMIRIQDASFGMEELQEEMNAALVKLYGADWIKDVRSSAEVSARFEVDYNGDIKSHQEVAREIRPFFPGATVSPGRDDNTVVIQVPGLSERIKDRIAASLGDREFEVLSTDSVGPKVGGELRRQGFISIAATLGLVLIYVAFRFDIGFAPGAVLALAHDVSLTVGVFVLAQIEFNLPMVGALLTIVGYSLNDTIVIYDRIRENRDRYRRNDLPSLLNKSISETLTRTVATSVTTFMAITMFLVLGGPVIQHFALAMVCGIVFGTYSTVFVASPMILVMEDLKPHLQKLVAAPPPPGDADAAPAGPMTASEQRRRERAEADKKGV
jgi:preprotein translocase subunit SecF